MAGGSSTSQITPALFSPQFLEFFEGGAPLLVSLRGQSDTHGVDDLIVMPIEGLDHAVDAAEKLALG
jgi:hypothetical protein